MMKTNCGCCEDCTLHVVYHPVCFYYSVGTVANLYIYTNLGCIHECGIIT